MKPPTSNSRVENPLQLRRMSRYVVLTHDHPLLHWDLMLEAGPELLTWRLDHPLDAPGPLAATPLAPHRLAYLTYEGPVSGDRGNVVRWDAGTFELLAESPDLLTVRLQGARWRGALGLPRTRVGEVVRTAD